MKPKSACRLLSHFLLLGAASFLLTACQRETTPEQTVKRPPPRPPAQQRDPELPVDDGRAAPSKAEGPAALLKGKKIDVGDITTALQGYVASRQINPKTITSLDVLVQHKFLPELPPPPPGKKYVWNKYLEVSVADK
jgi:hypothetical protein